MAGRTSSERHVDLVGGSLSGSRNSKVQVARRNSRTAGSGRRAAESRSDYLLCRRSACEPDVLGGALGRRPCPSVSGIVARLEQQSLELYRQVKSLRASLQCLAKLRRRKTRSAHPSTRSGCPELVEGQ